MKRLEEKVNGISIIYKRLDENEKEVLGLIDDPSIASDLVMSIKVLENGVLYHTAPFSENKALNVKTLKGILKEDAYIEVSRSR